MRIGAAGFGFGTVGMAELEAAEKIPGKSQHKALINIFLGGGPPHQDLWDLKMDAPAEIRGEFSTIDTSVPGIQICDVFPRIASVMQKCVLVRSVVGSVGAHDAWQCMTGWSARDLAFIGGRPSIGAVTGKVLGPVDLSVPPFVGLTTKTAHVPWSDAKAPGFPGSSQSAFKPDGPGMADMIPSAAIGSDRLKTRRELLATMDQMKREADHSGRMEAMSAFTASAFNVLTSSKLVDALDLSKESPEVRARYGTGQPFHFQYDGAPTANEQLLLARRLVEAGVRCVSLTYGRWDSHGQNFSLVRDHGAKLDQCLGALIEDLDERGMLDDVTVVAWGEFGRSPRINKEAGRDHWPQVSCALMAGGGMRSGQVIGSTNRLGEHAETRPVHFQEIVATLYRNLGINPLSKPIIDPAGRPQPLTENHLPLPEVV
jgi:hypothetical protein